MTLPDPPGTITRPEVDVWQKLANTALYEEVKNLRATATTWATSIATLTGLFTLLGVSFATVATEKIAASTIVAAQWLLVLAFGSMLVATILAILAAQGIPTRTPVNSEAYRISQGTIADTLVARLAASRLFAGIGMLFLILAGGLIIQKRIETLSRPSSGYYQVIQSTGPMLCGYGYYDTTNTFKLVKDPKLTDGKLETLDPRQLIAVNPIDIKSVSSCEAANIKSSP